MKLTAHKGTHTIGGSSVEVQTGTSCIIMDFGIPLVSKRGKQINSGQYKSLDGPELLNKGQLPDIKGCYSWQEKDIDAILISHSHLDHYGFLGFINPKIPVYMSQGCKDLISVAHYFEQTDYDPKDAVAIAPWEPVEIGDMKITPYLVDHSAFDAFAYLIEGEGKKVFYSGDFRGHGRKSVLFERILKDPPKNVNVLICEGTTLTREDTKETTDEKDVLLKLIKEFNGREGLILIASSSQNIDRIISIYKACRKSNKTFVISPYTAYILERIQREGLTIPRFDWKNIRVFFVKNRHTQKLADDKILYKFKKAKISYEEIWERKDELVILDSYYVRENFSKKDLLKKATLIYSQWEGYLKDEDIDFWKKESVDIVKIHSSGHVSPEDLKRFVKAIDPEKIVPVHTLLPERFKDFFEDKAVLLEEGQSLTIQERG